jgi:hypothetical protein
MWPPLPQRWLIVEGNNAMCRRPRMIRSRWQTRLLGLPRASHTRAERHGIIEDSAEETDSNMGRGQRWLESWCRRRHFVRRTERGGYWSLRTSSPQSRTPAFSGDGLQRSTPAAQGTSRGDDDLRLQRWGIGGYSLQACDGNDERHRKHSLGRWVCSSYLLSPLFFLYTETTDVDWELASSLFTCAATTASGSDNIHDSPVSWIGATNLSYKSAKDGNKHTASYVILAASRIYT